jgi:adenylate cyclase
MATFGAPVTLDNSSQPAVMASIKILEKVSDEVSKGNIPETRLGIGLHYDEAITGNIGSSLRKQYSITGKVVIMASRIEQLNKKYHTQLLISEEVFNQLSDDMKSVFIILGSSRIKGSEKLISIYKLKKDAD